MDILTFILLLTIVAVTAHFVNRYMNERKARYDSIINSNATPVAPSAATEEQFNKFNSRINDTWEHIAGVKQSLESLKLQIGLRNNK